MTVANQKPNSTVSVMFCTGATFVKKNSCLVPRKVSVYTVGLHLLNFLILELLSSKYILTLMVLWYYGFSFNSYVYYLTRGFIASVRAFNLLTCAFNLPTHAFSVPTRVFNLATRASSLLTCGFALVTRVLLFHL